jgi:sialate O-acetylesterase
MMHRLPLLLLLLPHLSAGAALLYSPFRVSSTFAEHAVLQREPASATIWGWTTPGGLVTSMLNRTEPVFVNATADPTTGFWRLSFPPQPAGGPYTLRLHDVVSNADVWYLDILFGDVLLALGQSNQDLSVSYIFNATVEAQTANDYPSIRMLRVPLQAFTARGGAGTGSPLAELLAVVPWAVSTNTSVWDFSAEGWLTARNLYDALRVPIGVIQSDWPGDNIAMLSSPTAVAQCANVSATGSVSAAAAAAAASASVSPSSVTFPGPIPGPGAPSSQWNAMIAPFLPGPLSVAAFIYHQGEADTNSGAAAFDYYKCALNAFIDDFRGSFGGNAATAWFGVAQLAPWGDLVKSTVNSPGAANVRAAQLHVCRTMTNVTCAILDDDGDPQAPAGSVHSRNKQLVARRLAAGALKTQYGPAYANLSIYGPLYAGYADTTAPGSGVLSATITFETESCFGGLGLVAATCPVDLGIDPTACAWFALQDSTTGAWANVTGVQVLNGTAVALSAPLAAGTGVRGTAFGWGGYPVVTLFSGTGLPVVPWNTSVPW